jgi:hypothetical protein
MYNFFIVDNSVNYNIFKNDKKMNNQIFKIKKYDTLPYLRIQVLTKGTMNEVIGYNLSAATAITFTMKNECEDSVVYSQSAETLCSSEGLIQYKWNTNDTEKVGKYKGEFEIRFSGDSSGSLSVPSFGYIPIEIYEKINNF